MESKAVEIRRLRKEIDDLEDGAIGELRQILDNDNLFDGIKEIPSFTLLRFRMLRRLEEEVQKLDRRNGDKRAMELADLVIESVEGTGFETKGSLADMERASRSDTPESHAEHCDRAAQLAAEYKEDPTPERELKMRSHLQGGELMTEKVPHKWEWVWTAGMATMVIVASMCVAGVLLAWCITGDSKPAAIPPPVSTGSRVIGEPAAATKPPFMAPTGAASVVGLSAPAGKTEPVVSSDTSAEFNALQAENQRLKKAAAEKPATEAKTGTSPRKPRTSGGSSRAGSRQPWINPALGAGR